MANASSPSLWLVKIAISVQYPRCDCKFMTERGCNMPSCECFLAHFLCYCSDQVRIANPPEKSVELSCRRASRWYLIVENSYRRSRRVARSCYPVPGSASHCIRSVKDTTKRADALKDLAKSFGVIREIRGVALERMIGELIPYLRGWAGYFGFSQGRELQSLDSWIRRRLRCVAWMAIRHRRYHRCAR